MIYGNGEVYRGNWLKDKKHFKGKMKYANGLIEEGQWKLDKFVKETTHYL